MLQTIRIKNLALVEDLTWEVGPGLVCVTGETGAGKSMIVGALKLILGERADRSLIRTGEENCSIEAIFQLTQPALINEKLAEAGLEPCEGNELLLKRVMTASGQNRQFVNNSPATLQSLKNLGQHLVDLHGPHDHQSLLSRDRQLQMLDAFAKAAPVRQQYAEAYRSWRHAQKELQELISSEKTSGAELDLLRYQVEEIERAALKPEEEDELLRRYKIAANASRLVELGGRALAQIHDDDDSVLNQLRSFIRTLRELERHDPALATSFSPAEQALSQLLDVEAHLRHYVEEMELDPAKLHELEERINLIESLKRKYGGSVEAIIQHGQHCATRLSRVENRTEEIERLQHLVKEKDAELQKVGTSLRQIRQKSAPALAEIISRHLGDLGFKKAYFHLQMDLLPEPAAHGMEDIDFIFTPNPGEPPKPLRLIASSGEMSRVMLAVKSALADEDAIPLLVFDEIDANVGGEIATAVGRKMATLGRTHQVISITHMPQVAALASSHFEVIKDISGDRTYSTLRRVEGDDRIAEISRMLGGTEASARAHAATLLGLTIEPTPASPAKKRSAKTAK